MLFIFVLSLFENFYAVDVGSEYFKLARTNFNGDPEAYKDPEGQISIPFAFALKTKSESEGIITNVSSFDGDVKFGKQAAKILEKNPKLGFQYLTRLIGRENTTEFNTSQLIKPFQACTLAIMKFFENIPQTNPITLVVPHYWSHIQKNVLASIFKLLNIPYDAIVDDTSAMAFHYGLTRTSRFLKLEEKQLHNVLFIDVGATSVKVNALTFSMVNDTVYSDESVVMWSEKTGGYFFRKAIAKNFSVSMKKAEKILHNGSDKVLLAIADELDEMYALIKLAAINARHKGPINEVQLMGGASSYPFILNLVKAATNETNIRREFNQPEAIAIGGVYASLQIRDQSKFVPLLIIKRPTSNSTLYCGSQMVQLCSRGVECNTRLAINHSIGMDPVATIITDDHSTPEGVSTTLQTIHLVNITNMNFSEPNVPVPTEVSENSYGIFNFDPQGLELEKLEWCKPTPEKLLKLKEKQDENLTEGANATEANNDDSICFPIQYNITYPSVFNVSGDIELINDWIQNLQQKKEKGELISKQNELMLRLITFFEKVSSNKVESTVHIHEEQKEKFQRLDENYKNGAYYSFSNEQLESEYNETKDLARSLRMKLKEDEEREREMYNQEL